MIVTVGGVSAVTVRVAAPLVAVPMAFVATHRNVEPLSADWAFVRVYDVAVAPVMSAPLRCHR